MVCLIGKEWRLANLNDEKVPSSNGTTAVFFLDTILQYTFHCPIYSRYFSNILSFIKNKHFKSSGVICSIIYLQLELTGCSL